MAMDIHIIRLANIFALKYKKTFGEIAPVSLLNRANSALPYLIKARDAGIADLASPAAELAIALGATLPSKSILTSDKASLSSDALPAAPQPPPSQPTVTDANAQAASGFAASQNHADNFEPTDAAAEIIKQKSEKTQPAPSHFAPPEITAEPQALAKDCSTLAMELQEANAEAFSHPATEEDWVEIENAARHVAGGMAEVWVNQARSLDPPTFNLAIFASRKQLGSFGDAFYMEFSARFLHKEALVRRRSF